MEWSTLNNICLGNQLTVNFAAEWSKDGRLFILSDNCVYVLKLTPKMTNIENILSFTRSEIQLCSYYAADHTGINYEEILLNLSQKNMYHQILNVNMTPKTKFSNLPNITPVSAAWSPILGDESYKTNALIGVISNTGNLEIFVQCRLKWSVVANVTQYWVEHLKKEWSTVKQANGENKMCEIHSERVHASLALCFGWSKIYNKENKNFLYIVVGHESGHVSLWKLNYFNSYNEEIKIEFVHSFQSDLEQITAINIHSIDDNSAWIIMGNIDGFVQSKTINFKDLNAEQLIKIWTYKDVRVSKIITIGFDANIGILTLKGPFIIFAVLNKDGTINFTNHLNFGNINISGIELISSGLYAVATTTGDIKNLKIIKTPKGYETKLYPILNDLKWDYHACHGIIKSPSETLWGILIHPCKLTDHLTLRSPIQMIFCTAKYFDPGSYLKANPTFQLLNSWECIEILRCSSAKNNTLPCSWLAKIEKYDVLSLYEIRLFLWISLICETFIQKRIKCRKLRNTLPPMPELKQILYFKYRIEKLKYLLNKFEANKKLTEFEYNSLYLLYDSITVFQKEEIYSIYFGKDTDEVVRNITENYNQIKITSIPKCLWCEENLSSKPCKFNHPDQRCCISGVQITGIAKWECGRCGLPAHELNEDEELFCPLCDIPMIQIT